MKFDGSRKGSALLIVLGMLAFMVVSAVSFSAYMRSSRLPSSYLRRTAASRQLAKAALAEAIERLDVAIAENPYPDQRVDPAEVNRPSTTRLDRLGETGSGYRNYWFHKIFIGGSTFLSPDNTVSTLTLEGLAYIPPPLVNEARRYSRMSRAATWHSLGFDSGRYAYCAIDVSDYFDVNRMVADGRRDSAENRITMAYLFEKSDHSGYESWLSGWENFMSNFREDDGTISKSKLPLISMADWNLAVNDRKPSGVVSPFCNYVKGATSFYGLGSNSGTQADKYRAMQFVTDSYLPGRALDGKNEIDISTKQGQPFKKFKKGASVSDVKDLYDVAYKERSAVDSKGNAKSALGLLSNYIPFVDVVNLYDYLDGDSIPTTLSLPTVERAPMVCGITPKIAVNLKLKEPKADPDEVMEKYIFRTLNYYVDTDAFLSQIQGVEATVLFPFKRGMKDEFSLDASIRLFFGPQGVNLRQVPGVKPVPSANSQDFASSGYKDGVFKLYAKGNSKVSFSNVTKQEDAVKTVAIRVDNNSKKEVIKYLTDNPAFVVKMRYDRDQGGAVDESTGVPVEATCNIAPVTAKGQVNDSFKNSILAQLQKEAAGEEVAAFTLYAAPYIRVKDKSGKITVDMVPAHSSDDLYNGIDNAKEGMSSGVAKVFFGLEAPIMRLTADGEQIRFTPEGFNTSGGLRNFTPTALMCPDPRYNFAPENWIESTSADASAWLGAFGEKGSDAACSGERDGDIFMFVSNQEYLQSVYELSFLPRLCDQWGKGDMTTSQYSPVKTATDKYPTTVAECQNARHMWRTYRCFDNADGNREDFESLGLVRNDDAFRVNPCSPSVDALMAAFANTPYDWWAASTNNYDISDSDMESAKDFNKKYAFNEMNDSAALAWEDLEGVAENFMDAVRTNKGDWEAALDDLEWDNKNKSTRADNFCGVPLGNGTDVLHSVDRKFLYGFWHDSFANRQQLFLVFVRAEPMMMGGGSARQIPPQLGARAVALVWRDPKIEGEDQRVSETAKTVPHRTRVLFYRQFE